MTKEMRKLLEDSYKGNEVIEYIKSLEDLNASLTKVIDRQSDIIDKLRGDA